MKKRLSIFALSAFAILIIGHYQNCTGTNSANSLSFGSSSTCPTGQSLDPTTKKCVVNYNPGFNVTVTSPDGTSNPSITSVLNVTGTCVLASSPQITIQLISSSNQAVQSVTVGCTTGGIGFYSVTLPTKYSGSQAGQVVPSAGNYILKVTATTTTGLYATAQDKVLIFKQGMSAPIVTGPNILISNPMTTEEAFNPAVGGSANVAGSCDGSNTYRLELRRFGLGPLSQVGTTYAVANFNGLCSNNQFTVNDITGVPNGPTGYNNYQYQVIAFAGVSASSDSAASGTMNVYVRPLPKDVNNDDTLLILRALASKLGYTTLSQTLNAPGFSVSSDPLIQAIFSKLTNFGNAPSYGIFQAACDIVKNYSPGKESGHDGTVIVLSALGINDVSEFNPSSNVVWDSILSSQTGYLKPQQMTNGSIMTLAAPSDCP